MADWRDRGYVPDSDDDDDDRPQKLELDSQTGFIAEGQEVNSHLSGDGSQKESRKLPSWDEKELVQTKSEDRNSGRIGGNEKEFSRSEQPLRDQGSTLEEEPQIKSPFATASVQLEYTETVHDNPVLSQKASSESRTEHQLDSNSQGHPVNVEDELELLAHPNSTASTLSDPPSDLSDFNSQFDLFRQPHGNVDETRPEQNSNRSSSIFDRRYQQYLDNGNDSTLAALSEDPYGHSLRKRKPIQLHPYVLESERYRQTLKDRGMKPLRLAQAEHEATGSQESQKENSQDVLEKETSNLGEDNIDDSYEHPSSPVPHTEIEGSQSTVEELPDLDHLFWNIRQNKSRNNYQQNQMPQTLLGGKNLATKEIRQRLPSIAALPVIAESSPPYATPDKSLISASGRTIIPENSIANDNVPRKRVKLSTQILSPSISASDSEASESSEIYQVQKRIKGVLPASWLRLDQKSHPSHPQRTQRRLSPMKNTTHPGTARRLGRIRSTSNNSAPRIDFFEPSEDSDSSSPTISRALPQQPTSSSSRIQSKAARSHLQSESDDMMEYDSVEPMFPAGRRGNTHDEKRTHDDYQRMAEKTTSSTRLPRPDSGVKKRKNPHGRQQKLSIEFKMSKKYKRAPNRRRYTAPALSVLDFVTSDTLVEKSVPRFLRVARRQARSRNDHGKHTPTRKFIRLGTRQDTEDVQSVLCDWRKGTIRAAKSNTSTKNIRGRALLNKSENMQRQQQGSRQTVPKSRSLNQNEIPIGQTATNEQSSRMFGENSNLEEDLAFQVEPEGNVNQGQVQKLQARRNEAKQKRQEDSRPAQLESLEADFFMRRPKAKFRHHLSYLDRLHSRNGPVASGHESITLQRFLAEKNGVPGVENSNEQHAIPSPRKDPVMRKLRAYAAPKSRKRTPTRIDAETIEYQQDHEEIINFIIPQEPESRMDLADSLLLSLGPFSTRQTVDFGIKPLRQGTFFHESTFIGSGELGKAIEAAQSRNYDTEQSSIVFTRDSQFYRWSVWNESVLSEFMALFHSNCGDVKHLEDTPLTDQTTDVDFMTIQEAKSTFRFFIRYFSQGLSFSDPIDRLSFIKWSHAFLMELGEVSADTLVPRISVDSPVPNRYQLAVFFNLSRLVLAFQLLAISKSNSIPDTLRGKSEEHVFSAAKSLFEALVRLNIGRISRLYENLRSHKQREAGIKDEGWFLESWIIAKQILDNANIEYAKYDQLSNMFIFDRHDIQTNDIKDLEYAWQAIFTILPLQEFNQCGFVEQGLRCQSSTENWAIVKPLVNRALSLYFKESKAPAALNSYCRTLLSRCHVLIKQWGWQSSEIIIGLLFDFFANRGLAHLPNEEVHGSVRFLEDLGQEQSVDLESGDAAFHIFLKIVACGFESMRKFLSDRKISNIAFRLMPNHGRQYPKDRSVRQEDLDALRNHHDLLSTLFWASPSAARPSIKSIRDLVDIENSHREACQINIRAWTNLARYMVCSEEPTKALIPFKDWHNALTTYTIKQHGRAKEEAYAQAAELSRLEGVSVSSTLLQSVIDKNERQVESLLSDVLVSLKKVLSSAKSLEIAVLFLSKESIADVLDLYDSKRRSLNKVITIALHIISSFLNECQDRSEAKESQHNSEDSQEYGDWTGIEEVERDNIRNQAIQLFFETIYDSVFRLLSNAFGAEESPEDEFLRVLTDTWVLAAHCLVQTRIKSWEDFLGLYQAGSWHSLRTTDQTRKYTCYFLAKAIETDFSSFESNRAIFLSLWMSSLVERDSILKYQNLLTAALLSRDPANPLLANPPFWKSKNDLTFVISAKEFRDRRMSLISSILSNMRKNLLESSHYSPHTIPKLRQEYTELLRNLNTNMKSNYRELGQGSSVTGTYVCFVQKVVELLQQHTIEFYPVDKFFMNPAAFPLPANDPNYVIGRLKNYGLKITEPRTQKQLIVFLNSISEAAAADTSWNDGKHDQLSHQLYDAISEDLEVLEGPSLALSSFLARDILSTYTEVALVTNCGWIVAQPVMLAMQLMSRHLIEYLDVTNSASIDRALDIVTHLLASLISVCRGLAQPSILQIDYGTITTTVQAFEIVTALLSPLDYINQRTGRAAPLVVYIDVFEKTAELILSALDSNEDVEVFNETDHNLFLLTPSSSDSSNFCKKTLEDSLRQRWVYEDTKYYVWRGNVRKQITTKTPTMEDSITHLINATGEFRRVRQRMIGLGGKGEPIPKVSTVGLILPDIM